MTIVWFILVLGAIILVHEFGHFLLAKLTGVYVYEFSLGMGPRLFKFKKRKGGETEYSIRLFPIGGYVQLAGEDVDNNEKIPKKRQLYSIFAFIVLFISGLVYGSTINTPVIDGIEKGYPADNTSLKSGDTIVSVDGEKIDSWNELSLAIQSSKGNDIVLDAKDSSGKIKTVTITPKKVEADNGATAYAIGISKKTVKEYGFGSAIKSAWNTTKSLFKLMFATLKSLFTGGVSVSELSGPVGIYTIVGDQAKAGFEHLLYLVAFLSVNVGVINLIPFPAFDGGRIFFLIIEKISRKKISPKVEATVNTIGFTLLMLLMVFVTFNDILRLF
jgi:regulator of sigma E protease